MSKIIWGPSIWNLFHCMSFDLKSENYDDIQNAINIIVTICYNLPCPICSEHAKKNLSKYNLKYINTVSKFRHFVFSLHNRVNQDLNKPLFDINDLNQKYENKNINIVLNNFFVTFRTIRTSGLTLYSFHRDELLKNVKNYFIKNKHLYSLN